MWHALVASALLVGRSSALALHGWPVLLNAASSSARSSTSRNAQMKSDMKADYTVAVLGDLHLDPRKMDDYEVGREHVKALLEEERENGAITTLVSLGDLGESKSVRPEETQELFAGTSECHQLAHDFLSSFECKPNDHGALYEVVGGNHDLEGIDEFATDQANLEAYLRLHGKPTPQFSRQIGEKTLLLGLGSSVFRTAVHTSHEVTIDDAQLDWFERMLENHPASEGWKVFVFTHAPPMGSGLRVLQSNHVVNGCCWLNHSGPRVRDFIELVRTHRCIKAWFSGHFHLGQDYEDSITFPTADGSRGSCVFAQTSVMRSGTSRDSRQQSRLIRGNEEGFEVCTVNHAKGGELRLDASITYEDDGGVIAIAYDHEDFDHDDFDGVYIPSLDDGCRVQDASGTLTETECTLETTQWWEMTDGKVLGLHEGMLLEYDPSTLAPLGLVVGADELHGRQVAVVDSSIEACAVGYGTEGDMCPDACTQLGDGTTDCAAGETAEQAVLLFNEDPRTGKRYDITVVQPNEDGSYWRKIVRNKMIRMKERRREQAALLFARERGPIDGENTPRIVSSWGPYTSTVGNAKSTGVPGLTPTARSVSK